MSSNAKVEISKEDADQRDKEEKKQLVVETIASLCTATSEFQDVRTIAEALKSGDNLGCDIVCGGVTNYSYKIYLQGNPQIKLFAKLAFNYAGWNPDRSIEYDLQRCTNEFTMMKFFSELMSKAGRKAPIATPYFLVDVPDNAKLLVTAWATNTDEPFAKQAIDGQIDSRVVTQIAESLALLNLEPVDPLWNEGVRSNFRTMVPQFKALTAMHFAMSDGEADMAIMAVKALGPERMEQLLKHVSQDLLDKREVLCHNDPHFFNILVEKKSDETNTFGPNGDFVLCDWEMSIAGPTGKDSGFFQTFPIASAMAHAVSGRREEALHLLQTCIDFFDVYAKVLTNEGNKDEAYIRKTFRQTLGTTGSILFFAMYAFGLQQQNLPLQDATESEAKRAKAAFGYVGLKCMELAYDGGEEEPHLDLAGLRARFKDLVVSQIEALAASPAQKMRGRRRCSDRLSAVFTTFDESSTFSLNL